VRRQGRRFRNAESRLYLECGGVAAAFAATKGISGREERMSNPPGTNDKAPRSGPLQVPSAAHEQPDPVRPDIVPWPHAPVHQLTEAGTFMVTAGTYRKEHHFREPERLAVLHRGLLTVARDFGWRLEAWAVFSNHYHFVAQSPSDGAAILSHMLRILHQKTALWVNRLDRTPGRKVWRNFWETRLTFERSYFARLNYVHQNAVKHGLVPTAHLYPWCSATWFETRATPAQVKTIYKLKIDQVRVSDDYAPEVPPAAADGRQSAAGAAHSK
jgi:putative transposase